MEKRFCREQASYRIIDSGPVCVIYSNFDSNNYTWIGTVTFNEPAQPKVVLPQYRSAFQPLEILPATTKQTVINWLIDTNETLLASQISCQV